jgi:3-hydroxyacyl-[acyl-carrier-protein] dehydratase
MEPKDYAMTFAEVKKHLWHRFPLLMVDRVLEATPGASIKAQKNVSGNEIFFMGHFPSYAIMPGVLIIESLAQTAAILLDITVKDDRMKVLGVVNDMRLLHPVYPGDCLTTEVRVVAMTEDMALVEGSAYVADRLAAKGKLSFKSVNIKPTRGAGCDNE